MMRDWVMCIIVVACVACIALIGVFADQPTRSPKLVTTPCVEKVDK